MSVPAGPAKTAPKIYQDFLVFDPNKGRPNVLADHTPPVGDGPHLVPPMGSCKHDYTTKIPQSELPPLDNRLDEMARYKLAVLCKKCRIHGDILIDYSRSTDPCTGGEWPLHHFQRHHGGDIATHDRITYGWQCSAPRCRATLCVGYRRPRLSDADLDLISNPELLQTRYEDVCRREPAREGFRQATPTDALNRLRKYVKDSLNQEHPKRAFPANNKRFMEAFGWYGFECQKLLERMGFKYATNEASWILPNPPVVDDVIDADGNSRREFLQDVERELLACMFKLSSETGHVNPAASEGWHSANRDIERILAAQGYARNISLRRSTTSMDELEYYSSLGALPDYSDSLVVWTFERQSICDPLRVAYYFECLQVITESRQTETLQMKTVTLSSQNMVSRRDLSRAYKTLGLLQDAGNYSDERVLESFQARNADLGQEALEDARQALNTIGTARQSSKLLSASNQSVETYEDALAWLGNGASKSTEDEIIIALYGSKVGDSAANEEVARKAISTIARERKSEMLNNWLLTGRSDAYGTMNLKHALKHIGVDSNLDVIDPTLFPTLFENARADKPEPKTERAIEIIQQALISGAGTGSRASTRSPKTWPIGLTSRGNTCYLNSLLQYYFCVKPLRDIVLNYGKYKLDLTPYQQVAGWRKKERVGQSQPKLKEIEGSQLFADELTHLFQRMVRDPGMEVQPEYDLVCRAFLEPAEYASIPPKAKAEAVDADKTENGDMPDLIELTDVEDVKDQSEASSATLQASVNGDNADIEMQNGDAPLTPPASPRRQSPRDNEPNDQAPPLPPRHTPTTEKETPLQKAERMAREQQDVTEAHDGAMYRLRSGMTPLGMDDQGEQIDGLRSLFWFHMTDTVLRNDVLGASKPIPNFHLQINVPQKDTDIYSALDAIFDPRQTAEGSAEVQFSTLRQLPPLLQISIPRVDFVDGQTVKSTKEVRLEDELYVDRYCDDCDPEVLPKRKRCWGWRRRIHTLQMEKEALTNAASSLDGPTTMAETAKFIANIPETNQLLTEVGVGSIDAPEQLSSVLSDHAEQQAERLKSLEAEIETLQQRVDAEFVDMKRLKYRLAVVFSHSGRSGYGHYWAYIHDFANNMWRKYSDSDVTEVTNLNDVFRNGNNFGNPATPSYAVYVKDEFKEEYVQPVCRAPEQQPTPPEEPVQTQPWTEAQTNEVQMVDDASPPPQPQPPAVNHVNTKTRLEGGEKSWDTQREISENAW